VDADTVIETLGLRPHPSEGGYFIETYRCNDFLDVPGLGRRSVSTAIYYLLTPDTCSAMHRLASDEVFHFYLGDPVEMLLLRPDGGHETVILGNDIASGHKPQFVVPRGVWQGSRLLPGGEFALLGTTVAPGFDFADYEHGNRSDLVARYPACADRIKLLSV
jgi:predicted cupin superfamily sugar epimerase